MTLSPVEFVGNALFVIAMWAGLTCALMPKARDDQVLRWARKGAATILRDHWPRMKRIAFACAGGLMLVLGIVGIVTPLLPTTIFLILAAWCFGRSSPRLETWMLDHPRFGPSLRRWREEGAVPRRAKLMAVTGMMLGYALFWVQAQPKWPLAATVAILMLCAATYVVSRPEAGGDHKVMPKAG